MVVIAIIGILTSLSVVGYQAVASNGKANGETDVLAQFMRNARLRSVSTGCPHVVRYRGYSVSTGGGLLTLYRKANCTLTAQTDLPSVSGDVVVNTYSLTPSMNVMSGSNDLENATYYVGFNPAGQPTVAYDAGSLTGLAGNQSLTIRTRSTDTYVRTLSIASNGNVTAL